VSKIASVLEDETDDDRAERALLERRRRAEQIADPERRKIEMDSVTQAETALKNWLTRRQADEVGANLFYKPRLKEELLKEGWCQLFDGHTDFGWKIQTEGPYGGGKFTFDQNGISSDPYHPGLVFTTIPFGGDLSLQFDFRAEKDSDVFLLLKTPPDPPGLNTSCYTFVLNSTLSSRPLGLLIGRHEYSLEELHEMRDNAADKEEGAWRSIKAVIDGNNCHFWIDNYPKTYIIPKPLRSGHVGFLVTRGKVQFQNILWQPNQTVPIFDTETMSGDLWRLSPETNFSGDHATGFRLSGGNVESLDTYRDYVLQMGYRQGMESGRSSLFLRALQNQDNTGYEISLQNFPQRKDRETARGVDAGSFRGLKDARYVRPQDMQWIYLTVAVMDRQMQTWIDGVPVCEIEDKNPINPKEDSSRGPFLKPGVIRLSVPQDNRSFQFRQLLVAPVP
jgi:hypothetical protein